MSLDPPAPQPAPGPAAGTLASPPASGAPGAPPGASAADAGPPPAGTPVSPRVRDSWRRTRGVFGVLAIMVVLAAVTVLIASPRPGGRLDSEATTPVGAHALAQLLRDQGVEVRPAGTVEKARELATPDSLLLVGRTEFLADSTLMAELAEVPGDRLLIEPVTQALQALAPGVSAGALTDVESREPGCDLPAALRAGTAMTGGVSYNGPAGSRSCYGGSVIAFHAAGRQITVVGSGDFMTNERLAGDGNAALAMNLAGARPAVVWLVPGLPQTSGARREGEATLTDLIPPGVNWAFLQLFIAVALVAVWRARRLGPVVAERLPVVVRAAETVEGRGRLYRSRRARDRAAAALRAATLDRIIPRLGLTGDATPAGVVAAVAMRTPLDSHQAGALLYGAAPDDDAGLVALARHLDILERQVRDS
ncbi:DUF4350 domain-containing protein [Planobispora takensis]|uniref:Membrane protein n=1 Tax=Planobispora takensis TaxID=1367882 RepID=A0A8J3WSR0_9ACTN|nr:DUF4350 domain-containing protein [Planobispora takensis]GII00924.1 membrane protein [Planobispora takensis]